MTEALRRSGPEISAIYGRHAHTVYRVCFLFLKNAADAQDAVQNTFLRLMEYGGTFESEEHEKAWLIVTASNLCKDGLRHWWRRTVGIDEAARLPCAAPETDRTLGTVLSLPQKYKAAVYLRYYEGYSCAEIARLLGKKEATVRSLLFRARGLLKLQLKEDDE